MTSGADRIGQRSGIGTSIHRPPGPAVAMSGHPPYGRGQRGFDKRFSKMTTPLAGITVLDFGQIYQGPYATMLMAKAGADVIKIEPPGGEPLRKRVIAAGGGDTTLPMAMLNANKRAVTLNLKSDLGKDLLKRMVAKADV